MTGVAAQADSSQSRLLLRLHRHIDALEARLRAQDASPPSRDDLRRQIRKTVLHELGHYFGFDDDYLHAHGY